jgi:hypothetical protein
LTDNDVHTMDIHINDRFQGRKRDRQTDKGRESLKNRGGLRNMQIEKRRSRQKISHLVETEKERAWQKDRQKKGRK